MNHNKPTQLANKRKALSHHTNINTWYKPKIIQVTRKFTGHAIAQAVMRLDSHCRALGLKPNDFKWFHMRSVLDTLPLKQDFLKIFFFSVFPSYHHSTTAPYSNITAPLDVQQPWPGSALSHPESLTYGLRLWRDTWLVPERGSFFTGKLTVKCTNSPLCTKLDSLLYTQTIQYNHNQLHRTESFLRNWHSLN